MTKKDNDILARDLVLAAFIVMKRQYESRDAGRAGKLQMFLNIHAGTHGDVKNIVAILNNPKSSVKLSDDQERIYQRALDIVESLDAGSEIGWTKLPVSDPGESGGIASAFVVPASNLIIGNNSEVIGIKVGNEVIGQSEAAQTTEQPKAKPGRKAKNPIEAATANAKKKDKACCN